VLTEIEGCFCVIVRQTFNISHVIGDNKLRLFLYSSLFLPLFESFKIPVERKKTTVTKE